MIKNQWYAVLSSKQLKKGKPIGVTRLSKKLVLWRTDSDQICCIADKCCHRGASLAAGAVKDEHIQCPFHGFEYDCSGRVVHIPANGKGCVISPNFKVLSYIVREQYGFIWIWNGEARENLPEIPFFEELKSNFSYGEFHENWNVHYTRAIENQLDVVHLPFVHRTTIGRGNKCLVNGPVVKWDGDLMTYYVDNVVDKGQKPLKADEIENYVKLFSLQLQMPNIWQNRVSDKLRIMAAFAPVDEENTVIYLRFYQRFTPVALIKDMTNEIGNLMNKVILHQDRYVVLTQLPKKSELRMGENLVQGDAPIIEYRKRREMLKQEAEKSADNE